MMKRLILAILLISSPAWAQTKPVPKTAARVDNCAPIGRTADGKLVYSMKCEILPALAPQPQALQPQAQQPAAPQAEAAPAPPPQPEVRRSGIFGLSFEVKRPDE
jgi:hypothetical protein